MTTKIFCNQGLIHKSQYFETEITLETVEELFYEACEIIGNQLDKSKETIFYNYIQFYFLTKLV